MQDVIDDTAYKICEEIIKLIPENMQHRVFNRIWIKEFMPSFATVFQGTVVALGINRYICCIISPFNKGHIYDYRLRIYIRTDKILICGDSVKDIYIEYSQFNLDTIKELINIDSI